MAPWEKLGRGSAGAPTPDKWSTHHSPNPPCACPAPCRDSGHSSTLESSLQFLQLLRSYPITLLVEAFPKTSAKRVVHFPWSPLIPLSFKRYMRYIRYKLAVDTPCLHPHFTPSRIYDVLCIRAILALALSSRFLIAMFLDSVSVVYSPYEGRHVNRISGTLDLWLLSLRLFSQHSEKYFECCTYHVQYNMGCYRYLAGDKNEKNI